MYLVMKRAACKTSRIYIAFVNWNEQVQFHPSSFTTVAQYSFILYRILLVIDAILIQNEEFYFPMVVGSSDKNGNMLKRRLQLNNVTPCMGTLVKLLLARG
ncbi:unnamed protein product [Ilex paraguariensis]|uniref:Uncharacterized protein n=1 Tax=Ilex paraguariensis TaxID=185542 RepID=A0ABC8T8I0_9AQUA